MINEGTSSWKTSLFVIAALVVLLGLILFVFFIKIGWEASSINDQKTLANPTVEYQDPLIVSAEPLLPPVEAVDPILGEVDADLSIIYFADFNCPYCRRMTEIFHQIIPEYEGRVNLVWKDFLTSSTSVSKHKAARCAQLQGGFWEYSKRLLLGETPESSLTNQLIGYAEGLGLDKEPFVECLADPAIEGVVYASTQQVANLGIKSAPSYFIGDDYYEGFIEYEDIKKIIDEKLGISEGGEK